MVTRVKSQIAVPARILIVDDNHAGMMARRAVLQELGYTIDGVTDPHKALELFRQQHYDLVVTDYKMPQMNGTELIEHLRAERPSLPIIMISGFVESLGLSEANTGADAVIMKSANEVQHLIRTTARLLKPQRKPARRDRGALANHARVAN